MKKIRKRTIRVLFLALLSSQACAPCHIWHLEQISTSCPLYNSARLYCEADTCSSGIELELDNGASGLRMYVNIFSLPVIPLPDNPFHVNVEVEVNDNIFHFCSVLMQGGQRILLPDEARDLIIEALISYNLLTLSVGRYSTTIDTDNFVELYSKL